MEKTIFNRDMHYRQSKQDHFRMGLLKLLEIKDSDIRLMDLKQGYESADNGIHIGGAFSAVIPLVALYYSGVMRYDVSQPLKPGQDMFVLSKGHAVASLASIYADLGYFSRAVLKKSRSIDSILNGHPGPILPGIHVSTGPLGQGLSVAQGFSLVGKKNPKFNVFCLTGDGELQEGISWEAVMFSSYKGLDNLCLIIDNNHGQLDDTKQLKLPLPDLDTLFKSYGWKTHEVDGTQYSPVLHALEAFCYSKRDGRPTAVICNTQKGFGGFSILMTKHKITLTEAVVKNEIEFQNRRRKERTVDFIDYLSILSSADNSIAIKDSLIKFAKDINLEIEFEEEGKGDVRCIDVDVKTLPAPPRIKKILYDAELLPKLENTKKYSACNIVSEAMKVFAQDPRVVSVDADLASASGLETGVSFADKDRAFNVGVAEANMMGIGEALAVLGYNSWVSTFCPFFDWKVLRRIAIGYQERLEVISKKDGWLSNWHGLDLTFLATAPNFETQTNGATHMGNDDVTIFKGIAHLKIIDISCPNQLLGVMKWIMEGNKGLIYLRIMRAPSGVIYDMNFQFEYGRGYILRDTPEDEAVIVSSGRGVHEALTAANELLNEGINIGVVDMSSIDEKLLIDLYDSDKFIIIAEQNNGYIWSQFRKILFDKKTTIYTTNILPINCLEEGGKPQFIHSATYAQLADRFGLSPAGLKNTILKRISKCKNRIKKVLS